LDERGNGWLSPFPFFIYLGLRKPVTPVLRGSFSEISLKIFDKKEGT
jgi:hypothetical protein